MGRVGGLIVIVDVTAIAGIRGVVIIAIVTGGAGLRNVCPFNHIVVVVFRETGGFPSRVCRMTGTAAVSNADGIVVGVGGGVEVGEVTTAALFRQSGKCSVGVATAAIGERVASGQGEKGVVGIGSAPGKAVWRMAINAVG